MKRLHGAHNKSVCDNLHLQDELECNDWVVTISFYSSIHYLDHALFPCDYDGNQFNNINEAHKILRSRSKHRTRGILLSKLLPKHVDDYNFLISQSQDARYVKYDIHDAIADRSVRLLNGIIKSYDKEKKDIK